MSTRISKRRMLGSFIVFAIMAIGLISRLFYLQIIMGSDLKQKAIAQQTTDEIVSPRRGTIFDRNGKALAVSITAETVVVNPTMIVKQKKEEEISKSLSEILEMNYDDVYKVVTKKGSGYELLKKRISDEQTKKIMELKDKTGITLLEDSKRNYVFGELAGHILGFTGFDNQGLNGVESVYDNELKGTPGRIEAVRANGGHEIPYKYENYVDPVDGLNVVLTIDEVIQHFAEKTLNNAVEKYGVRKGGAILVMQPKTGEILAMAVNKGYDPNKPFEIVDPIVKEEIAALPEGEQAAAKNIALNKQWRNRGVTDSYEPGSVFKMVTGASGLEEGVVTVNDTFVCTGSRQIGSENIKCWRSYNPHGAETFAQGFQNSCNPVFMEVGLRLGAEKFQKYYEAFGFTKTTGFDLPGEASGVYHHKYTDLDLAISSFGQSQQITPLQMICAGSAIVNGGKLMKPYIVKQFTDKDGNIVKSKSPEMVRQVISEQTSETMRGLLEGVVTSGTGSNAHVKGFRVGGKTGTSEKLPRGTGRYIASFLGFAPANDPQVVVLIILDEATPGVGGPHTGQGGQIAAPTAGLLLDDLLNYLEIEPQYTQEELMTIDIVAPDVRGQNVSDAKLTIENLKLKTNVVGSGTAVVDQQPKGSATLNEGSTIILYTEGNADSQSVTIPNVIGHSLADAKNIITSAGLNFKISGVGDKGSVGAVAAEQIPAAGTIVPRGTVVNVEFRKASVD